MALREDKSSRRITREGDVYSVEVIYHVNKYETETVIDELPAYRTPYPAQTGYLANQILKSFEIRPIDDSPNAELCQVVLQYVDRDVEDQQTQSGGGGGSGLNWELQLSGETQRITHANVKEVKDKITVYNQEVFMSAGGNVAALREQLQGAINVRENGEVDGVDINFPIATLVVNQLIDKKDYSSFVQRNIFANRLFHVNNDRFWGWDAGEVLFNGASIKGSFTKAGFLEANYSFLISPNVAPWTVVDYTGREIRVETSKPGGVGKYGWQYVWTYASSRLVETQASRYNRAAGKATVGIKGVIVSDLYDSTNLSELNLTPPPELA